VSERSAQLVDFGGVLTTSMHDAFRAFSLQISDEPELLLRLLSGTLNHPGCSSRTSAGASTTRASSMASRRADGMPVALSPTRSGVTATTFDLCELAVRELGERCGCRRDVAGWAVSAA
jgi:hypothetical protein